MNNLSLAVICSTKLSPLLAGSALASFSEISDEIILASKESQVESEELAGCTQYLVYPDGMEGLQSEWLLQQSTADWVLILPEAAMASSAFLSEIRALTEQAEVDALQIPLLWLSEDANSVIYQQPWNEQPGAYLIRRSAALGFDIHNGRPNTLTAVQSTDLPLYRIELAALPLDQRQAAADAKDLARDGLLTAAGQPLHQTLMMTTPSSPSLDTNPLPDQDKERVQALLAKQSTHAESLAVARRASADEILQFHPAHTLPASSLEGRIKVLSQPTQWTSEGSDHLLILEISNLSPWFWCGANSSRTQVGIEIKWRNEHTIIEAGKVPLASGLASGKSLQSSLLLPAPAWKGSCQLEIRLLHVTGTQISDILSIDIDLAESINSQLKAALDENGMLPISKVLEIRQQAGRDHALWNDRSQLIESTSAPTDPRLCELLKEMLVGDGALDGESLDMLQKLVQQVKPQSLLEFGSGSSTIALGWMLKELHGDNKLRLISVEQDQHWAEIARERIAKHGLQDTIALIHAPLSAGPDGNAAECYTLNENDLAAIANLQPEMCLIDGPAYRAGQSRNQVLGMVIDQLADNATILLDDVFRDPELSITARWDQRPDIDVIGVWPTSKGVTQAQLIPTHDRNPA